MDRLWIGYNTYKKSKTEYLHLKYGSFNWNRNFNIQIRLRSNRNWNFKTQYGSGKNRNRNFKILIWLRLRTNFNLGFQNLRILNFVFQIQMCLNQIDFEFTKLNIS